MPGWLITLLASLAIAVGGGALRVMYRIGSTMGRINESLQGLDNRLAALEGHFYGENIRVLRPKKSSPRRSPDNPA